MFPRQSVKHVLGVIRQESGGTRHADTQTRNRAAYNRVTHIRAAYCAHTRYLARDWRPIF